MQICRNNYQIKSKQNAFLCIVMFLLGGIVSVASEGADKIHLFFFLCMMVKCSLITLLPGVESCLTKARTRVLFNQVFFNRRYSLLSFRLPQHILILSIWRLCQSPIQYAVFLQNQLTNSTNHITLCYFFCTRRKTLSHMDSGE